jgi:hypothetical protein
MKIVSWLGSYLDDSLTGSCFLINEGSSLIKDFGTDRALKWRCTHKIQLQLAKLIFMCWLQTHMLRYCNKSFNAQCHGLSDWHVCFIFGRRKIQWSVTTEGFYDFRQYLQALPWTVPVSRQWQLPPTSLLVQHSLSSFLLWRKCS